MLKFVAGFVLASVIVIFAHAQEAPNAPPLPVREGPTVQDLKDQIADCQIDLASGRKWETKLIARIRELEQEIAAGKKSTDNK